MGPRTLRLTAPAVLALALASCAPAARPGASPASSGPRYFGDVSAPHGQVLTFDNGTEPQTTDPGIMSGQPDGRVARIMFEGLVIPDPRTLAPRPGQAYRWEESADGLTYVFHLRPGLRWSDGRPVTAHDFAWSWRRVLEPATGSRYSSMLYVVKNGEAYNKGTITDPSRLGLEAPDDSTFIVTLESPTPYFLYLAQFYTCLPVPRWIIERYGDRWTQPGHVVSNGPFVLTLWRQGDRFEFVRNPNYWDAAHVRLDRVVAYSVEDLNTAANLYKAGVLDWLPSGFVPSQYVPYLDHYSDYRNGRYQGVYFYSINVTKPPLDNVWVRRALAYAVDREAITHDLLHGSRDPWGGITPTGYPGYDNPPGQRYDPEKAREFLARAGYPGGRGFPRISILFNTSEDHRRIAEAIQAMWKRVLGIDVELSNQEWGTYLAATTGLHYEVARRSWIGDYLDPNTFLGCWRTGDGNNRTGWSDPEYDALLQQASVVQDPAKRFAMLRKAEVLLLDQAPVIPIYHYTTVEMVKPYVRGLYHTALDTHPLNGVWIDHDWRRSPGAVARRDAGGETE